MRFSIPSILTFICKLIPFLIIIALLGLSCLLLFLGKIESLVKLIPFIVCSLFASFILICYKKRIVSFDISKVDSSFMDGTSGYLFGYCNKLYVILFILSVTWLLFSKTQDIIFFIFLFQLYAISVIQIFAKSRINESFVLLQLFLTSLLLVVAQVLCHPYFYGIDDIFPHVRWSTGIMESGALLSSEFGGQYAQYPLLHIGIAATSMLSGVDIYFAPYVLLLVPIMSSVIFVYYIAKHFTKSSRIALASSFFYLMIPVVLRYATSTMAFVLATLGFFIILYILTKEFDSNKPRWIILALLIILYMTFVHHASVVVVFAGLFVLLVSYLLYRHKVSISNLITLLIFFVVQGIYFVQNYLDNILNIVRDRFNRSNTIFDDVSSKVAAGSSVSESTIQGSTIGSDSSGLLGGTVQNILVPYYSDIHSIISYLVLGILTCILLFGIYYIGSRNHSEKLVVLLPFLLLFTPIFVQGMIEMLGVNIEAFRFRFMIAPIYAVALGVGAFVLHHIFASWISRPHIVRNIACILCIVLVIFSPLYLASTDAKLYVDGENEEINYLSENDLVLLNHIEGFIPDESRVLSDHIIFRYYSSTHSAGYDVPYYSIADKFDSLITDEYIDDDIEWIVFRHNLYERGELEIRDTKNDYDITFSPTDEIDNAVLSATYSWNKPYENGYSHLFG